MPTARNNRSQGGGKVAADYWSQSRRPLVSLVFISPVLVVYEVGILALGAEAMRNGADGWLRGLLAFIGLGQYFLLPLLTCGILLAWHHVSRQRWGFRRSVLVGMLLESTLLAIALVSIYWLQSLLAEHVVLVLNTGSGGRPETFVDGLRLLVGFCGAGVYEELLFRAMLLPGVALLLRQFRVEARPAMIVSVILTSLLFSAVHFQFFAGYGDPFNWFSFSFRFVAGVFFAVLFFRRGFGVTAGAHTIYDIVVGLILA